jgi:hypothetical protein
MFMHKTQTFVVAVTKGESENSLTTKKKKNVAKNQQVVGRLIEALV